jgi:hypothetical protein
MSESRHSSRPNRTTRLTVHRPDTESVATPRPRTNDVVYWRVNGYRAAMLVWTDAEFAQLPEWERPADAQHFSCGIWAVLRMV